MRNRQITSEKRYMISTLMRLGLNQSDVARVVGRHRSFIARELRRNRSTEVGPHDDIFHTAGASMCWRAISTDILDFRARVLAIEGSKLRLMDSNSDPGHGAARLLV